MILFWELFQFSIFCMAIYLDSETKSYLAVDCSSPPVIFVANSIL